MGRNLVLFLPERKVVFVSVTTLSLFGVLSYIFTGVGLLVGVFALIKGYFKDRDFKDN
jgi:hypothetical protein